MPATGIDALRIRANTLGNMMICFDSENELTLLAAGEPHLLPKKIKCVDDTLSVKAMNIGACSAKGQKKQILAEVHVPLRTNIGASFTAGVLILNGGEADLQCFSWQPQTRMDRAVWHRTCRGPVRVRRRGSYPASGHCGLFKQKGLSTPHGTNIHIKLGFGGPDVFDWAIGQPEDEGDEDFDQRGKRDEERARRVVNDAEG
jgi:hypothetical protein